MGEVGEVGEVGLLAVESQMVKVVVGWGVRVCGAKRAKSKLGLVQA